MMAAPEIRVRKTIAQHLGDDWWMTMDEDGEMAEYPSSKKLVRAIRRRDAEAAKTGESTATLIEWRDVPEGFEKPEI